MGLSLIGWIPDGNAGTVETLRAMRSLADVGKRSQVVRSIAVSLVSNIPQRDGLGEIRALRDFVYDRIRYVRDIRDVETLQTPEHTLEIAAGDCDDKSTLLAALLESIGFKTRFSAYAFGDSFSHVLVEVYGPGGWISLETTVADKPLGWEPPNYSAKISYPKQTRI